MSLIQNVLKGYIIGTNKFNFQDARVDDIESIISRTAGQQGIEVRNNRLALTNGGYYEDGMLFENTPGEEEPTQFSRRDNDDLVATVTDVNGIASDSDEWDWVSSGSDCQLWLYGVANDGSDIDIELDLDGRFTQVETRSLPASPEYIFRVYDENENGYVDYSSRNIQAIKLVPNNQVYNLIIYFDNAIDSFNLYEAAIYLVDSEPQVWPDDLVYSDGLMDKIVAYLIDNNYISDPNAL